MNYWTLNAIFLALTAIIGCCALATAHRRGARAAAAVTPMTIAVTLVFVVLVTAVFDNLMIGVGLVGYNPAKISGVFVGIAPLEDFAYAVAAVVLLPSIWVLLERKPELRTEEKR